MIELCYNLRAFYNYLKIEDESDIWNNDKYQQIWQDNNNITLEYAKKQLQNLLNIQSL